MCMNRVNYSISAFVVYTVVISVLLLSVSCSKSDKKKIFIFPFTPLF